MSRVDKRHWLREVRRANMHPFEKAMLEVMGERADKDGHVSIDDDDLAFELMARGWVMPEDGSDPYLLPARQIR